MRKISLIPYKIAEGPMQRIPQPDGTIKEVKLPDMMFDMKRSIGNVLFIPELNLDIRAAIEHDRIARKVEAAGDEVVLEEAEYAKIKTAMDLFKGYGRKDLEFIHRIRDAPEIDANTPDTGGK
jgi:hypothetical protein